MVKIYKGDSTEFANLRQIVFTLITDLTLTDYRGCFAFMGVVKEIPTASVVAKSFTVEYTADETKTFPLGQNYGKLTLFDANDNPALVTNVLIDVILNPNVSGLTNAIKVDVNNVFADYNQCGSKPKLNGVTIEGEHDSAYYNILSTEGLEEEIARAKAAETALGTRITAETARATEAEQAKVAKPGVDTSAEVGKYLRKTSAGTEWASVDSGTVDYNDLENKPQIGSVELKGNKALSDFGIASATDLASVSSRVTAIEGKESGWDAKATAESVAAVQSSLDMHTGDTSIHVTEVQKTAWTSKQNAIADLATIRSNATAGATAAETISAYGDIVTHDTSEFATSAQGALAGTALQRGDVKNNVTSTDTQKPLSANMGKTLNDRIDALSARGRYLSVWDCATGLPATNPTTSPYLYKTGDYFIVGTVAASGGTNYRPDGSSYTAGVASTTVESSTVNPNDTYYYDGTNWNLLKAAEVTVSFAALSGQPTDNAALSTELANRQKKLVDSSYVIDAYGNIIRKTFAITPATGVTLSGNTPIPYYTTKTNGLATGGHWDFAQPGVCTFTKGEASGDGNKLCAVGTVESTTLQFYDTYTDWPTRENLIATAVMSSSETVVGRIQDLQHAIQTETLADYSSSLPLYTVGTWIRHDDDLFVCREQFVPGGAPWTQEEGSSEPGASSHFASMATVAALFGTDNASLAATINATINSSETVAEKQTTANLKTSLAEDSDTYYPSQKAVKTAVDAKQDTANLVASTDTTTADDDTHYPSTSRMTAKIAGDKTHLRIECVADTYSAGTTYAAGAFVAYEGKAFQAKQATTGNTPVGGSSDLYWRIADLSSLFSSANTSLVAVCKAEGGTKIKQDSEGNYYYEVEEE